MFPCADYATSDAQKKPRTDLLCQKKKKKKKTVGARREQKREQDRGNGTIMLRKTI